MKIVASEIFIMKYSLDTIRNFLNSVSVRYYISKINTDHLAGFENFRKPIPDHLTGDRYIDYSYGICARKFAERQKYTYILWFDKNLNLKEKTYKGWGKSYSFLVGYAEDQGAVGDVTISKIDPSLPGGGDNVHEFGI